MPNPGLMSPEQAIIFALLGAGISIYAISVGAGGGFLFTPLLLLWYEDADPAAITMAALSVVALNSAAAAALAARARLLDYPVILVLLAAALPGSLIGALGTSVLPRSAFAAIFAALLIAVGVHLIWRPVHHFGGPLRHGWPRRFRDGEGNRFAYRLPLRRSLMATTATAAVASLTGIGGGLLYTPMAMSVMRMPRALAAPTAYAVIAGMALTAVTVQAAFGSAAQPMWAVPPLAAGALVGGSVGWRFQRRSRQSTLTRLLAVGLIAIGVRSALLAF